MSKYFYVFLLLFCFLSKGFAQNSMNDYSYIIIPNFYEFSSKNDEYQINSLTKFLFNKHGFHAFLNSEKPENIRKCDGLYVDVIKKNSLLKTKMIITVADCNNKIIYQSREGVTRIKEYKKAYHGAIRDAFKSVAGLGIKQKEIVYGEQIFKDEIVTSDPEEVNEKVKKEEKDDNILVETKGEVPLRLYSSYTLNGTNYLLKKTSFGFQLLKDLNPQNSINNENFVLIGKIVLSSLEMEYTDIKTEKVSNVYFDNLKQLIVETENQKLVYKLVE